MDPTELIKAAPEIAKGLTAVGAAIPFTGIVKKMLGPAADELAKMWEDQIRLYRYERQMKCVEKAAKMAKEAGFKPKAVAPKILFPLLEGASMEEDEGLHTMWAALLVNAASPENAGGVRPGFIAILREMAPDEAHLLQLISGLSCKFEAALQASGFVRFRRGKKRGINPLENHDPALLAAQVERIQVQHRADFPPITGLDFGY
jgi:hypothetical protein